jgi:hypothetical protein
MRNILVAVIGVLTMTLFVGSSFATAPVASDIPDIRLLTGSGTVEDFDLSDYVTDYDDDPASLNWTIQGQVGFDVVTDPASVAAGLVDIAGSAAADQGTVTYRVADASEYSEDTQVVKYSSFWLAGPTLTQDNNLVPEDAFPRTWVLEADTVLTTPVLADLLVGTASVDNMYVCIADLAGDWQAGDNAASASYDGLDVSISGDGKLVLQTPTLPTAGNLTGAYRVGVKAKKTSGGLAGAEDNWDGMELLVASARVPTRDVAEVISEANAAIFDGFESAIGTLPATPQLMRTAGGLWYSAVNTGGAVAAIAASAPASSWATEGQALEVTVPVGAVSFVQSEFFAGDIEAGETITIQANVATDVATGGKAPNVMLFMGNFQMPYYQGVALNSAALADSVEVPLDGAAGWRTVKATFAADAIGAAVATTDTTNYPSGVCDFHQNGYQAAIVINNKVGAAEAKVYVDNVRVYKSVAPMDAALGATEIAVEKRGLSGSGAFDGTLESAADVTGTGFGAITTGGTLALNTVAANNMFTHDGSKSLEVYVPAGTSNAAEFARVILDIGSNAGEGIFGASVWIKTNSPDVQSNPDIMFMLSDNQFRVAPFIFSGIVAAPLDGAGWKKLSVDSAMLGGYTALWLSVSVKQAGALPTRAYFPSDMNTAVSTTPGIQSDGHVYFDDFKIHKYQDDVTYFDRSVFPATD